MTIKAIWNGQVIAESENTEMVDRNHYFPMESINREFFKKTTHQTSCPWKGKASYFSIVVKGKVNSDAAWYYSNPSEKAMSIKNYVAFWRGVEIVEPEGYEQPKTAWWKVKLQR